VSRRLSAALIVSAAAALATPASAAVVQVHLTAREAREGDIVQVTLRNAGPRKDAAGHPGVWHPVDFHAALRWADAGAMGRFVAQ